MSCLRRSQIPLKLPWPGGPLLVWPLLCPPVVFLSWVPDGISVGALSPTASSSKTRQVLSPGQGRTKALAETVGQVGTLSQKQAVSYETLCLNGRKREWLTCREG